MSTIDLRKTDDGPRLLVSVRSQTEAAAAIAGGADILDLKDPSRGSLGRPDGHVLEKVCHSASPCGTPITTALGEVTEWMNQSPLVIPDSVSFAKLGLAGLRQQSNWVQQWLRVRAYVESQRSAMGWVAVAYVDEAAAGSPSVRDVLSAAIDTGCAGLLLDTWDKSTGRLHDYISDDQLDLLSDRVHAEAMFIAAAGRLSLSDVGRLAASSVDVIAVRSAACEQNDRQSTITAQRVAECKAAIRSRERLNAAC